LKREPAARRLLQSRRLLAAAQAEAEKHEYIKIEQQLQAALAIELNLPVDRLAPSTFVGKDSYHTIFLFKGPESIAKGHQLEKAVLTNKFNPLPDHPIHRLYMEEIFSCGAHAVGATHPYKTNTTWMLPDPTGHPSVAAPTPKPTSAPIAKKTGVCMYGDWVMVDRFDGSFWGQRQAMGYVYDQRNFKSFKEMLDWSSKNKIEWGWKEGANYGQLFHRDLSKKGTTPAFEATISAKSMDDCSLDTNDPGKGKRYSFVKKDVLLNHPSWKNTKARSLYQASLSGKPIKPITKPVAKPTTGLQYFVGTKVRPDVAKSTGCSEHAGGKLAMPKTQAEQDALYNYLRAKGGDADKLAWLGAHLVNGVWRWDDGSKMTWTNWDVGQGGGAGQPNLCMQLSHGSKNWHDCNSNHDAWSVCQTAIAFATPSPTQPTKLPTGYPTEQPSSLAPTGGHPTVEPTNAPTEHPTTLPTALPTKSPTVSPTEPPTRSPTVLPTLVPTPVPTYTPSEEPTEVPTPTPTEVPTTLIPTTDWPTIAPSFVPTEPPTPSPTSAPTEVPSHSPTRTPTNLPTGHPTRRPTRYPTRNPTRNPTRHPTRHPTRYPTFTPTRPPTRPPPDLTRTLSHGGRCDDMIHTDPIHFMGKPACDPFAAKLNAMINAAVPNAAATWRCSEVGSRADGWSFLSFGKQADQTNMATWWASRGQARSDVHIFTQATGIIYFDCRSGKIDRLNGFLGTSTPPPPPPPPPRTRRRRWRV